MTKHIAVPEDLLRKLLRLAGNTPDYEEYRGPADEVRALLDGPGVELVAPVRAVPDGWQLVPKHATHEMCEAVHFGSNCAEEKMQPSDREFWEACYADMLAAAPQPDKENTACNCIVECRCEHKESGE